VVITGASSGIGKATALAFAAQGARLALTARRGKQLEDTAAECRNAGAEVVTQIADVADYPQVEALGKRATNAFGGFDVWINNAGMDVFGSFEQIPLKAFSRVIEINLMGTIHGAKVAMPHFHERGSGVLINNASMVGACPTPFHSAYVASKFAIRGLSHSMSQELMDNPEIHVCTISPASIDTPLWQRGGNYSGRKVKPIDPVYPPEQVADIMVKLALQPRREVFAGAVAWMLAEQHSAAPDMTEDLMARFIPPSLFKSEPAVPSDGSLFEAKDDYGGTSGGWLSPNRPAIPASDMMNLFAAPALLGAMPQLYAWQLSCGLVEQFGRQFANGGVWAWPPPAQPSWSDRPGAH
jgi:short-subunit dehydrogenase